ncbi:hypothetical protein [Gimesia sp.]|uniref:hypothetical protein n=1 Tax=Gimesia sp. TaxID=2024833 RepID=UPI000C66C9F1|nr:hypothetical protein [Gimesia sp.]MAX36844.1 hypothetical protein [Gimesia sp.]HAH44944.1 hypothetical protein [Planctomycetaceae bacterium]HBL47363.1 hypothetical protein [Planctomycetaceae bacterium]
MKYFGIVLLTVTVCFSGGTRISAESGTPTCDKANGACGSCNSCNSCSHGCKSCRLHVETLKVKKHCFNIECKEVCIPPVRFPWQKCCELKCGKIKTVRVLKKHEYTCEKCGYKWDIENLCGACPAGNCETIVPPALKATALPPLAPATSVRKK